MPIVSARYRHLYKTAAQWTAANTVLGAGEIGCESDTGLKKIGDGTTAWNSLDYDSPFAVGSGSGIATASFSLQFYLKSTYTVYYTTLAALALDLTSAPSQKYLGIPHYALIQNTGSSDLIITPSSTIHCTDSTITVPAGSYVEISYIQVGNVKVMTVSKEIS